MGNKPKAHKGAAAGASRAAKASLPAQISTHQDNPHFCFQFADRATKQAWKFEPSEGHAPALVGFICDMAKLTWAEIEAQRVGTKDGYRRRNHSQEIKSLTRAAQQDLMKRKLPERFDETMFRFRLSGEQRLWGFRKGHVFHIVWWDPDHKVYPTEKKRT